MDKLLSLDGSLCTMEVFESLTSILSIHNDADSMKVMFHEDDTTSCIVYAQLNEIIRVKSFPDVRSGHKQFMRDCFVECNTLYDFGTSYEEAEQDYQEFCNSGYYSNI